MDSTVSSNTVKKMISFPKPLYMLVERKAEDLGVSFSKYLQMLVFVDVKEEYEKMPKMKDKFAEEIMESLKEGGKRVVIDPNKPEEMKKILLGKGKSKNL